MSAPKSKQVLVTHALPYANGPLHIGHLLGYIQTDVWVRARRMAGDTVHFVAADDVHGTPIMLAAEKAGLTPEAFIRGVYDSHVRDFVDFGIVHDCYHTTHSPENKELAEEIYRRLKAGGHIAARSIRQLYDPVRQMFLPDRYVKGICPNCGTPDQYGDNCENCGATYAPTDLKDPRSVLSGATPELRDSEHYFFQVGDFAPMLRDWLAGKLTNGAPVMHPSVAAKLREWLDAEGGVRDWDISRDAPYFGFPIPDAPGKFFYVWLDAPIGYLASFKRYCASEGGAMNGLTPASFDAFLEASDPAFDPDAEMHHFIGKDIVNFHGLFWPAMLKGAALRTPTALHVNGYLTVNGEKMSKSRGTFVMARTYLDAGLDPDYLRYYFATMLSAAPVDIDLDLKAFEERVNSHLVGKFVNIASRCARLLETHLQGTLSHSERLGEIDSRINQIKIGGIDWQDPEPPGDVEEDAIRHLARVCVLVERAEPLYFACEFHRVTQLLMEAADVANEFVNRYAPWALAKDPTRKRELEIVIYAGFNMFRSIAIGLKPLIPSTIARVEQLFNEGEYKNFSQARQFVSHQKLNNFQALLTRIDAKKIETMIEASKESLKPADATVGSAGAASVAIATDAGKKSIAASAAPTTADTAVAGATSPQPSALSPVISIDDFAKLDLRVGKVLACEFVEGSDKLLRFELDAGELGKRQIFSGIRAAYGQPEKLVGRNVVFIANLAPRKMRFGVSEGMILSAGTGGDDLFLLDADTGAQPGAAVK